MALILNLNDFFIAQQFNFKFFIKNLNKTLYNFLPFNNNHKLLRLILL